MLLIAPAAAWGQDVAIGAGAPPPLRIGGGVPDRTETEAARGGAAPWGAAGALAVVLGLFAVGAKVYSNNAGCRRVAGDGPCEALAKLRLEPRATVHVVRIGRRVLVVGSGADGLRTLSEIADPVEADALAAACRAGSAGPGRNAGRDSFRTMFGRTAADAPAASPTEGPEVSAAERRLAARLRPAPLEAAA